MKIVLHSPTIESAGQRSCMTPQSPCIGIQLSVRLVSQDTDAHLELGSGDTFSLGRKASLGISAKNVSRDHCTVTTGVGSGHLVRPVVSANKKVYILRHGEAATLHAGELSELLHGDTLYLTQEGSQFKHGFFVDIPGSRLRDQEAGNVHQPKYPPLKQSPHSKRQRSSGQGREDHPAPKATSAGPKAQSDVPCSVNTTDVFCGLTFVFWTTQFMTPLMIRAKQAGAEVTEELLIRTTTHVVASRDFDADEAARKLQVVEMHATTECYEVSYDGGKLLRLPKEVHFVTPEFVSECLAHGQLQPEREFLIDIVRMAVLATGQQDVGIADLDVTMAGSVHRRGAHHDQSTSQEAGTEAARNSDSRHGGDLREPSRVHAEHHGGGEMSQDVWEQWQRAGFVPAPAATLNSKHGSKTRDAAPTSYPTSKDVDVTERDQGASDVSKPSLNSKVIAESPGGLVPHMDTSSTVTERGSCGVWDVAYDKSAAEETVRKLGLHWHRQEVESVKHAAADGSGDRSSGPGTTVNGGIPGHNGSQELASFALNNSCAHTACSAKEFCIVDQLEEIEMNYRKGRDQFKIKAIQRAIKAVVESTSALVTADDCEKLGIGEKSIEKLQEIVSTGEYRRNQIMAQDPHHRAISLFMEVWGTGEATAERWYRDGCRSLEDVQGRSDLSMQQRTGMKYFEDFKQRIPRSEVAAMGATVCDAAEEVLDCSNLPDGDLLFCSVLGSYTRGKPLTGDVDMLIAPPPSCGEIDSRQALHAICKCLQKRGLLLDDMASTAPAARGDGAATFMGVARHATSPCARRVDIKFYPRRVLPFAIMHFTGSGAFSRALRYWARSRANEARRFQPSANGFKLSDYALVPIQSKEPTRQASNYHNAEVELGPSLDCKCEGEIFRALGLDYVPPHMRYFHNFE